MAWAKIDLRTSLAAEITTSLIVAPLTEMCDRFCTS
jgi:hypothetical protein